MQYLTEPYCAFKKVNLCENGLRRVCFLCLLHNSFSAVFDNHNRSVKQLLIRKTHVFPEDFGYTEGQDIYIFCAFGRWAVIAEGLIVFQENREWETKC